MTTWSHDADYVLGKLRLGVGDLATSGGGMVERLRALCTPHLMVLSQPDFPPSLVDDWKWIHDRLTSDGPICQGDDVIRGSFDNTLDHMSEADATEVARRLVELRNDYEEFRRRM